MHNTGYIYSIVLSFSPSFSRMSALRHSLRVAVSDRPFAVSGVWHADELGACQQRVQATGYGALDAQLPGGGWPVGALSEVLQPVAGLHEWQLVTPALAQAVARRAGVVVMVAPPCEPFAPALQARGLPPQRWCVVRSAGAAALWAAEQALRCPDVLALLAWLPQVQPAALRRLQVSAAQQQQLLWVFRPAEAGRQASPALLRLQVEGAPLSTAAAGAFTAPGMRVHILKRRGPPLGQALDLPGCHLPLAQALAAQAARHRTAQAAGPQHAVHSPGPAVTGAAPVLPEGREAHALDRVASAVGR